MKTMRIPFAQTLALLVSLTACPPQKEQPTEVDSGTPATDAGVPNQPDAGRVLKVDLKGAVQKGPFVTGSTIVVSLLDSNLAPTGQNFNTSTTNSRGEFEISFQAGGPVALEGVGYYYNEVVGGLSQSPLTLRGFYIPQAAGAQQAYVNIVTHLTTQRIKSLVLAGTSFTDAVTQAEGEFLAELGITVPSYSPVKRGIDLNVAGGDTDDNAYLLAVSSVLTQVAALRGGSIDAKVQELLNTAALDFEDGTLAPALKAEISAALLALDVEAIETALSARLVEIGATSAVPGMGRVLDQDRDGIGSLVDNCPRVANPGQENSDGDAEGDACDRCPNTMCPHECLPADASAGRPADTCYQPCVSDTTCGGPCLPVKVGLPVGDGKVCAVACDPLASNACAEGDCVGLMVRDLEKGSTVYKWGCLAPVLHGSGAAGDVCGQGWLPCAAGLVCIDVCRVPCDTATAAARCNGKACTDGICDPSGQVGQACFEVWPPGAPAPLDPYTASCAVGLTCDRDQQPWTCVHTGLVGEHCRADGTCENGLVCHTPRGSHRVCLHAGGPGEPCLPNDVCDAGLFCDRWSSLTPKCAPAGGADQSCLTDGTCNAGFACLSGSLGFCPGGPSAPPNCCKPAGALGQPCGTRRACNANLACLSGGGMCDYGQGECCMKAPACTNDSGCAQTERCVTPQSGAPCAAGDGSCCLPAGQAAWQPCDKAGFCTGALACRAAAECPHGLSQCCVPAGLAENDPCGAGGKCHGRLTCVTGATGCRYGATDCCKPAGEAGQPCPDADPCANYLACTLPASGSCPYGRVHCCEAAPLCINLACTSPDLSCIAPALSTPQSPCPQGQTRCCLPTGGAHEACSLTAPTCELPTLECRNADKTLCENGASQCCIPTGGSGENCTSEMSCNPGLRCLSSPPSDDGRCKGMCCYGEGGLYEPCIGGTGCNGTYTCHSGESRCPGSLACCF